MQMYEYIPPKNSQKLSALCVTLFIGAVTFFGITTALEEMSFRWVFQLIAMFMLTAGVFVTSRYIMKNFIYRAERLSESGSIDFTVTEVQNRHRITVCRISLDNVEDVCVLDGKQAVRDQKKKTKAEKRKFYDYSPDPFVQKKLCVRVTECRESLALYLSYDEELEKLLTRSDV